MKEIPDLHTVLDRLARIVASEDWSGDLNPAQVAALEYLARANRFSRKPSVVADYLGATRGTVSQTLKALVRKGLLVEEPDAKDRRSISYGITPNGKAVLEKRRVLDDAISGMSVSELSKLDTGLRELLRRVLATHGHRTFGACKTCIYHENIQDGRRCRLLNVELNEADAEQICVEHALSTAH